MSKGIEEAIKDSTIGDVLRNAPFPAFAMPGPAGGVLQLGRRAAVMAGSGLPV